MKFGMNLLLWTAELHEGLYPVLEQLKAAGFDGVEIPVFHLDVNACSQWAPRLDDLGLERTAVTVRNAEDNPMSSDASVRAKGVMANQRTLDCCRALGASQLVGPFHSAIGEFSGAGPTEEEWNWAVDSMQQLAEYAGQVEVNLGVEPLNRFEAYLINTAADAARFVRQVDHPRCRSIYDTFHANIEEKNVRQAIESCADVLGEVHICENDRSTPGLGNVPWKTTFDTLHSVGYDGWLVIEAFGMALPELVAATKIWRKMYDTELKLATDGLEFMKQQVTARWT